MKYYRFTGILILLYLFCMSSCADSAAEWGQLYSTESEDAGEMEDTTEEDSRQTADDQTEESGDITSWGDLNKDTVTVYICGAVFVPGVYELPTGARVNQAIEAAGGLREEADQFLVNQARVLEDGEQIRVYTKEEAELMEEPIDLSKEPDVQSKININQADKTSLMCLPGIGEAKAEAIIAYREENGGFQSIEEIMNIPGIKDAVFSKIKDQITI